MAMETTGGAKKKATSELLKAVKDLKAQMAAATPAPLPLPSPAAVPGAVTTPAVPRNLEGIVHGLQPGGSVSAVEPALGPSIAPAQNPSPLSGMGLPGGKPKVMTSAKGGTQAVQAPSNLADIIAPKPATLPRTLNPSSIFGFKPEETQYGANLQPDIPANWPGPARDNPGLGSANDPSQWNLGASLLGIGRSLQDIIKSGSPDPAITNEWLQRDFPHLSASGYGGGGSGARGPGDLGMLSDSEFGRLNRDNFMKYLQMVADVSQAPTSVGNAADDLLFQAARRRGTGGGSVSGVSPVAPPVTAPVTAPVDMEDALRQLLGHRTDPKAVDLTALLDRSVPIPAMTGGVPGLSDDAGDAVRQMLRLSLDPTTAKAAGVPNLSGDPADMVRQMLRLQTDPAAEIVNLAPILNREIAPMVRRNGVPRLADDAAEAVRQMATLAENIPEPYSTPWGYKNPSDWNYRGGNWRDYLAKAGGLGAAAGIARVGLEGQVPPPDIVREVTADLDATYDLARKGVLNTPWSPDVQRLGELNYNADTRRRAVRDDADPYIEQQRREKALEDLLGEYSPNTSFFPMVQGNASSRQFAEPRVEETASESITPPGAEAGTTGISQREKDAAARRRGSMQPGAPDAKVLAPVSEAEIVASTDTSTGGGGGGGGGQSRGDAYLPEFGSNYTQDWDEEDARAITRVTVGREMSKAELNNWIDAFYTEHQQWPWDLGPFDGYNNFIDHLMALGESQRTAAQGSYGSTTDATGNSMQDRGVTPGFWEDAYYNRYRAPTYASGWRDQPWGMDRDQDLLPGQYPGRFDPTNQVQLNYGDYDKAYEALRRPWVNYMPPADLSGGGGGAPISYSPSYSVSNAPLYGPTVTGVSSSGYVW